MRRRAGLHTLVFLALLVLPFVGWLAGANDTDALAERRRLAERPSLPRDAAALRAFPAHFEAWWDDHFGFRSTLIRRSTEIAGRVQRRQAEMGVGHDGWLFLGKPSRIGRHRCVAPKPAHVAQWRAGGEDVILPDHLGEIAGAQPVRQRARRLSLDLRRRTRRTVEQVGHLSRRY